MSGITLSAIPPEMRVALSTSTNVSPPTSTSSGVDTDDRPKTLDGEIDRVHALPRPGGVRALALEDERGVEVAEAAGVDRVVGRLEHDDEVGVEHERSLGEHARQGALVRRQLLTDEEEERHIAAEHGPLRPYPAGKLDHHREPALHVARSEPDDPAVLDPARDVALRGDGVEMAGEQHEGFGRALCCKEERLVGRVDAGEGDRTRHVVA